LAFATGWVLQAGSRIFTSAPQICATLPSFDWAPPPQRARRGVCLQRKMLCQLFTTGWALLPANSQQQSAQVLSFATGWAGSAVAPEIPPSKVRCPGCPLNMSRRASEASPKPLRRPRAAAQKSACARCTSCASNAPAAASLGRPSRTAPPSLAARQRLPKT
jgi:hypothetical protein